MNLVISLDINNISLQIKAGRKVVGELSWVGEYTLNEKLLPNIDALLKKNKISPQEIKKVIAKISKNSGVTSTRIVQTLAKGWNAAQAKI
jgi:tRNA A37 threonylcarbamoyladenosine modification protein TsaB